MIGIFTLSKPDSAHHFKTIDVKAAKSFEDIKLALENADVEFYRQSDIKKNPDYRIKLNEFQNLTLLSEFADSYQGISPADEPKYGRQFWEISYGEKWTYWQSTPNDRDTYSGREKVIWWSHDLLKAFDSGSAFLRGQKAWRKKGIVVRQMRQLDVGLFLGDKFDTNAAVIIPKNESDLSSILAYCQSIEYSKEIRKIDKKVNVTNATLVKVPFDLPYWQQVAAEKYPNGLPEPYSNDPTQWLFKGTILDTTEPLHVAVARLLGYRWPDQAEDGVMPDADGIVPLPGLGGERAASERLLDLLAGVYGADWNEARLRGLLAGVGAESLADWLQNDWFAQHGKLFHHRPFLWHVWDGRKDGFSAIVNYHTLDRARLEKLTYTYLGAWITAQRGGAAAGERGADARLAAAQELQKKLEAILTGEPPYDIYVRWKKLAEQPHGWNPDLNDGVRLNIRPFVEAGVLRSRVNVKWGKDRGSDPGKQDFGEAGPQTDLERHRSNERHNDLHFTQAQKLGALE